MREGCIGHAPHGVASPNDRSFDRVSEVEVTVSGDRHARGAWSILRPLHACVGHRNTCLTIYRQRYGKPARADDRQADRGGGDERRAITGRRQRGHRAECRRAADRDLRKLTPSATRGDQVVMMTARVSMTVQANDVASLRDSLHQDAQHIGSMVITRSTAAPRWRALSPAWPVRAKARGSYSLIGRCCARQVLRARRISPLSDSIG